MPIVVQACIVIATLAIVVLTIMAIRLMRRLEALSTAASRSLGRFDAFLEQSQKASVRIDGMLVSLEHMTGSVRASVDHLGAVVHRATGLTSSVLDEVERPVRNAVAMFRAVQAGAAFLAQRWTGQPTSSGAEESRPRDSADTTATDPLDRMPPAPNSP